MALKHEKLPDMPVGQCGEPFRGLEVAEDREHEAPIEGCLRAEDILINIELTKADRRVQVVEHRHPGCLERHVLGALQTETAFCPHQHRTHRICPDIASNIEQSSTAQNFVREQLQPSAEIRAASLDDAWIIEENRLIRDPGCPCPVEF